MNAVYIVDAAFCVLCEASEPLNYRKITSQAIEQGLYQPKGATPWMSFNAAIRRDIHDSGESSRFVSLGNGKYGLAKTPIGVGEEIDYDSAEVRNEVLRSMHSDSFKAYKDLVREESEFKESVGSLSKTEVKRLATQRIGQDRFRQRLLKYWNNRCVVTGIRAVDLLRASHIKPWAECKAAVERLNVYNGLLLAAHLDAAFDKLLITVEEDGSVVLSEDLRKRGDHRKLGLHEPRRIHGLTAAHQSYLTWHRHEFHKRHGGVLPTAD